MLSKSKTSTKVKTQAKKDKKRTKPEDKTNPKRDKELEKEEAVKQALAKQVKLKVEPVLTKLSQTLGKPGNAEAPAIIATKAKQALAVLKTVLGETLAIIENPSGHFTSLNNVKELVPLLAEAKKTDSSLLAVINQIMRAAG